MNATAMEKPTNRPCPLLEKEGKSHNLRLFTEALLFLLFILVLNYSQARPHLTFLSRWDNDNLKQIGDQTFNDLWGWAAPDGKEYAIIGSVDSLYFIEVTDPKHPVVRDAAAGKYNNCIHRDFQTYSHYAYCVADEGQSSLQIFDLQYLPDSVHKVYDSDTIVMQSHDIFIEGKWLYFAYPKTKKGNIGIAHSLIIASLDDPENPQYISTINSNKSFEYVHDLYVKHDTAFMSCGNDGLYIYDFKDHANPQVVTSIQTYPDQGFNHSNWVTADSKTIVFTDENHNQRIKKYDISNLHKGSASDRKLDYISLFGSHSDLGSIAHNPFIKGSLVFVSYYQDGVVVFNMNDSDKLLDYYDTYPQNSSTDYSGFEGCWGVYPFLPSGTVIASDMTNGLFCLRLDSFSGIESGTPLEQRISIFPNPVKDNLTIQFSSHNTENIQLFLFTLSGQELWKNSIPASFTDKNISFTLPSGLSPQVYLLRVISGKDVMNLKLLKE